MILVITQASTVPLGPLGFALIWAFRLLVLCVRKQAVLEHHSIIWVVVKNMVPF